LFPWQTSISLGNQSRRKNISAKVREQVLKKKAVQIDKKLTPNEGGHFINSDNLSVFEVFCNQSTAFGSGQCFGRDRMAQ